LAEGQIKQSDCSVEVSTFAKWAQEATGINSILNVKVREAKILKLGEKLKLENQFLLNETDYLLGRFLPDKFEEYLDCERIGRGNSPRMDRARRESLLNEVIQPYSEWKIAQRFQDWSDLAVSMIGETTTAKYDAIIVDEAQDFSANQIRSVMSHASSPSTVVFVIDAMQRIYPRGCTWQEVKVKINSNLSYRLGENHRNTKEICRFAAPLLKGMSIEDDGTIPDLRKCSRHGPVPIVLKGRFSNQCKYALKYITTRSDVIDPISESIVFLHPKGGGWFDYLRKQLQNAKVPFVELTRESEWPDGPENVGLSTMYSAKGLEFDHVIALGLNDEITRTSGEHDDTLFENYRRLLAMSITRARKTVLIGYNPRDPSKLIELLDRGTYQELIV
jgi:superfamily I DNA/RNA helicase